MRLPYGVLRCGVVKWLVTPKQDGGTTQYHLNVLVDIDVEMQRIAINIGTSDESDTMFYRAVDEFRHPITDDLDAMRRGLHSLSERTALPALDFKRSDVSGPPRAFIAGGVVTADEHGEPCDTLERWLAEAKQGHCDVFAFGRYWDDADSPNPGPRYFDEESGRGIHDIHMNQGSTGRYLQRNNKEHNEVWQDGALIVKTATGWRALFSAFAGQRLPTDDDMGNPRPGARSFTDPG